MNISDGHKRESLVAFAIVSLLFLLLLSLTYGDDLMLAVRDNGETLIAHQAVQNFRLYGFKYFLLQDHATGWDLSAHPHLYTHNAHIGSLLFSILDWLGVTPIAAKQAFVLTAFCLGLVYAYKTTKLFTNSFAIAITTLLLFSTDFLQSVAWSLNALRAWHWLGLFGMLHHCYKITVGESKVQLQYLYLFLFSFIAFCVGYGFAVTCIGACVSVCLLSVRRFGANPIRAVAVLIASSFLIFIARQLQVIGAVGASFWWFDLTHTLLIKLPLVSDLVAVPPLDQIEAVYRDNNVLRAGAGYTQSFAIIWQYILYPYLHDITVPANGLFSSYLAVGSALLAILLVACFHLPLPVLRRSSRIQWEGAAVLLASLSIGIVISCLVFPIVTLNIYLKHQVPLIAALFLLPKAYMVGYLCTFLRRASTSRKRNFRSVMARSGLAAVLAFAILLDHAALQIHNFGHSKIMDLSWIKDVQDRASSSFAVSGYPFVTAAFTTGYAVAYPSGTAAEIVRRAAQGRAPFKDIDFVEFSERDGVSDRLKYERPDYFLYRRRGFTTPYDTRTSCMPRYVTDQLLWRLFRPEYREPVATNVGYWFLPGSAGSPDRLYFKNVLHNPFGNATISAQLAVAKLVQFDVTFVCPRNFFVGVAELPGALATGTYTVHSKVTYTSGEEFSLADFDVRIDRAAIPVEYPEFDLAFEEKSADELLSGYDDLDVVARGQDHFMLDMRGVYERLDRASQDD